MKERLVFLSEGIIYFLALVIAMFTTITSYLYRVNIENMSLNPDDSLKLIGCCIVAVLVIGLLSSLLKENSWKVANIVFWIIFLMDMLFCLWWICNAQSTPANDSRALYDIARQIIGGDFVAVAPENSYLSLWPFQSGLLLYMEMVIRLIPISGVITLSGINFVCMGIGIISLYRIICLWTQNAKAVFFWSFIILFCTPYLFYVNFLYNEITSMACIFFTVWMMTEYWIQKKNCFIILSIIATGISVVLRNNSMIFVVAFIMLLCVFLLKPWKKRMPMTLIIMLISVSLCATRLPQKIYEVRAGNTMGDGVPMVSYIAMGLQDSGRIPGWNNGYHSSLLMECGYDSDKAADLSKQSIKESLHKFKNNPRYMFSFFYKKLVPEWCDENYSCLYSTEGMYGKRTQIAHEIYRGRYTKYVLNQMNVYQSILYTGFLLYILEKSVAWCKKWRNRKKQTLETETEIWSLVLLVTIIGGFLFETMWEGGSRYTMPYMVMMTPYSAIGFCKVWEWIRSKGILIKVYSLWKK